ncbi:hypothetical protein [Emergencia sp.]|uniref:hypothetical protein n=1 Tax=Emergencia sp. TaxID=1926557 RepID=UPI003AEFD868
MSRKIDDAIDKLRSEAETIDTRFTTMMARQISELIKTDTDAECILQQGKMIAGCKKEFDNFAGKHKQGGQAIISPEEAEELIVKYFGLDKPSRDSKDDHVSDVIDIMDFL